MKTAFGFLMDQWVSAGLLPSDFRGTEHATKQAEQDDKEDAPEDPCSNKKSPDKKLKKLINKFEEKSDKLQAKKLKEFDDKFATHRPSTSSTDSAPAELNNADDSEESMDEQEEILNGISLENLFDEDIANS